MQLQHYNRHEMPKHGKFGRTGSADDSFDTPRSDVTQTPEDEPSADTLELKFLVNQLLEQSKRSDPGPAQLTRGRGRTRSNTQSVIMLQPQRLPEPEPEPELQPQPEPEPELEPEPGSDWPGAEPESEPEA